MIDKVLSTIKKHKLIGCGEGVVAGVSGGPDSVCLLHVLNSLKDQLGIRLYAVHINHMLRGDEAESDAKYVEALCTGLNVPVYSVSVDVREVSLKLGVSLEEAGREVRYRELEATADRLGAAKIAVAHNKNDQAETVLMNIIRGTGLDGLKGMDYCRGRIVRPLLGIERNEIEEYCIQKQLNPHTDKTNLESVYTRNKIRLDLIPLIEKSFGIRVSDSIWRMTALLKDDRDFIEEAAFNAFETCAELDEKSGLSIDIRKLGTLHPAIKKRVIRASLERVKGDLKGVESIHIDKVLSQVSEGGTGSELHLPSGIRSRKSYGRLQLFMFAGEASRSDFSSVVSIPGVTTVENIRLKLEASLEKCNNIVEEYSNIRYNSLVQFFDYEGLITGINIRNRREGDVFKPLKSNGTKKLKEFFIDNKVPRHERDKIPLITRGNEVVWVIGFKISDKFKVTENTKTVLRLECKKEKLC
jgi:tRNA(Ile)-lysidine synthase